MREEGGLSEAKIAERGRQIRRTPDCPSLHAGDNGIAHLALGDLTVEPIPPIDAQFVRLICLSSVAEDFYAEFDLPIAGQQVWQLGDVGSDLPRVVAREQLR